MKFVPVLVLMIALATSEALACSCHPTTDEEEFRSATSVLLVRITKTEFVPASSSPGQDAVHGQFEVVQSYKGDRGALEYLVSHKNSCWRPLVAGELYIVFSRGAEFERISMCSRSRGVLNEQDAQFLTEFSAKQQ